jgi:dihydroxyacetone kinase-like predicted kinase
MEKTKNLFSKDKSTAPKSSAKKDEKVRINLNDSDFFDKISMLESLQDRMKSDKAQADMLADEIKDLSKEEWVRIYEKTGKNPGSIFVESIVNEQVAQVMFVPSDKYITVNADKAEVLIEKYGQDIIEEKTTFSFDNDMIEKYGEILSNLIMSSDGISDSDKEKIIKASTSYSISKGTIDKMKFYGPIGEIMEEVKPVVSLKNVEVVKG